MISRPRFARLPWLATLAVLVTASVLTWPAVARAQYALRFSNESGAKTPGASLLLRPNIVQDFYIYIDNLNDQAGTVKVEIRANDKPLEGASAIVEVKKGQKYTQVPFGKPAAPVPPPAPGALPVAPPPPPLAEVKGALKVVLLDMADVPIEQVPLTIEQPKNYIDVKRINFNPMPGQGRKNQLRVELKANPDKFVGPRCRIDLVLDDKHIPGLIEAKKFGTRGGFIASKDGELVLTADNLEFADNRETAGFVHLTIDGWERAIIYRTTFPREGTESTSDLVNTPLVRLLAPLQATPGQPVKVEVQADNLSRQVIELGLDRDDDKQYSRATGEVFTFAGNRDQRILINPTFPNGALQLKPEVKDWSATFDMAEVYGARTMRVRLLKDATEAAKPKDEDRAIDESMNQALGESFKGKPIFHTLMLDGSPPEGVKFVNFPERLLKGKELPVSAVGVDPETKIKEVVFFVGKLGPDGKIPPNAPQAAGKLTDAEKGIWSAALDAPTEMKGKFDVSVVFVNFANLVTTDTIKIELVDPAKDAGAGGKAASIEGKVVDIAGRPQGKGVTVELRDAQGAIKDSTKTDDKSGFAFKDIAPGSYRLFAVRTANNTRGATTVQVKEGEKKTDVELKIAR